MQHKQFNRTFKKDEMQEHFEKFGYVIVKNFISEDKVDYLRGVYKETETVVEDRAFYISQWSDKKELKFKINNAVQEIFLPEAEKYLVDYEPVFGVFGVKLPKPDSAMYLHGDWSHVDETNFRTVNIWCPLLDINENNGAVCLIKGSNRIFDYIRGAAIPDAFHNFTQEDLQKYLSDIYLKKGDAIMWDHAIVHGSRVNKSPDTRVAAVLNMKPKAAKFYLYFANPPLAPSTIDVYEPPKNFFLTNDSANNPDLIKEASVLVEQIPYESPSVSKEEIESFLEKEFGFRVNESKRGKLKKFLFSILKS